MSLLALSSWCWGADMADNLMENCQKRGYPICGVVDKRRCSAECESCAWLPLPLPTVLELKGSLVHGEGPNLRAAQIKRSDCSPAKWQFLWALVIFFFFTCSSSVISWLALTSIAPKWVEPTRGEQQYKSSTCQLEAPSSQKMLALQMQSELL